MIARNYSNDTLPPRPFSSITRWIDELGCELMWIGVLSTCGELICLPNRVNTDDEPQGWRELPDLLDIVPDLLSAGCRGYNAGAVVRTRQATYVFLCSEQVPWLILSIDPAVPMQRLKLIYGE